MDCSLNIPVIIPSLEPDKRLIEILSSLKAEGFCNLVVVNDGSSAEYDNIFEQAKWAARCCVMP